MMITHRGALGDNIYTMPAVEALKRKYDELYLSCVPQGKAVFENTGLIAKFIVHTKDVMELDAVLKRNWLLQQSLGLDFEGFINFHGVVPGRYMYRSNDPLYELLQEEKIARAKGANFFDEMARKAEVPEAIGKRPDWHIKLKEKRWLRYFRARRKIPDRAKLVAWQFTGSGPQKWYPYFDIVVQEGLMADPDIYVIGMGDMEGKLEWSEKYHHGRFINLTDKLSFRQSVLLTSIVDCLVSPETGIFCGSQAFPDVPKILLASHTSGEHICCGDETTILTPECDCAPCYNIDSVQSCMDRKAKGARCMLSIDPLMVRDCVFGKLYGNN